LDAGQGTDTARYLAAGAQRALFLTAGDEELAPALAQLIRSYGVTADLIFESNRILLHLKPDLCLAVDGASKAAHKPSFDLVLQRMDAMVALADRDGVVSGAKPCFQLAALERISPQMVDWLRGRLPVRSQSKTE
jgi:hypothetical protein